MLEKIADYILGGLLGLAILAFSFLVWLPLLKCWWLQ
jgi:hypothetical protein